MPINLHYQPDLLRRDKLLLLEMMFNMQSYKAME